MPEQKLEQSGSLSSSVHDCSLRLSQAAFDDMKPVINSKPHHINDDEYFKIAGMMTPGPWSAGGHMHELDLRTEQLNGKKVIVYDTWRPADPSKDSFDAKPTANDIRSRTVFVPDEKSGTVHIYWMDAKNSEFQNLTRHLRTVNNQNSHLKACEETVPR